MSFRNPDLTRIRDNQRRSRARRGEHLRDLEQRIRDYELRGIQASQTLQTAARAVMQENAALRILLRRENVSDTDVEAFLRDHRVHKSVDADRPHSPSLVTYLKEPRAEITEHIATLPMARSHENLPREVLKQDPAMIVQQSRSSHVLDGRVDDDWTLPLEHDSNVSVENRLSPPQSHLQVDTLGVLDSAHTLQEAKNTHSNATSCLEAAMIIATMSGSLSMEEAEARLGCPPINDCQVDNLTLFRMMDQ